MNFTSHPLYELELHLMDSSEYYYIMQKQPRSPLEKIPLLHYFLELTAKGGPNPEEYEHLNEWFKHLHTIKNEGKVDSDFIHSVHQMTNDVWSTAKTMYGHVSTWPYGYPGDFEIIDKIYQFHLSEDAIFSNWDRHFHSLAATKAVRNRKTYFQEKLKALTSENRPIRILNLASGPCRDLLEFFEEYPNADLYIDCVELDKNAIAYAQNLLGKHLSKVNFIHKNVFRYQADNQYDMIWSAGLFDYFDDSTFIRVLRRQVKALKPDGQLIIGNFHPRNPSRYIMEFSDWHLNHRTNEQLITLGAAAGFSLKKMHIEMEEEGINLFLNAHL